MPDDANSRGDAVQDAAWWRARPAEERWQAMERARQLAYGESVTTARIEKVFVVTRLDQQ
jgi:hypothetical protein